MWVLLVLDTFCFEELVWLETMSGEEAKSVKSVSGHFKAEDSGVWEKDIAMDTQLSVEAEANLKGQVGGQ